MYSVQCQECIEPAKPAREHALTYTHNVNGKIQIWRMVVYLVMAI